VLDDDDDESVPFVGDVHEIDVRERAEYFQTRQDAIDARNKAEQEELERRRSRSNTPDTVRLAPSDSVPDLVAEKEGQQQLLQQRETLKGRSTDEPFRTPPRQRLFGERPEPPSPESEIDDMVDEADRNLRKQSDDLDDMFQKFDRNLQASYRSQGTFSSDSSLERSRAINALENELSQAERQYSKGSYEEELDAAAAESLERTRAMMAEDDVVPSRRNDSSRHGRNAPPGRPVKKGSLMVRTFSTPLVPPRRGKGNAVNLDSTEDDSPAEIVHKEASFEVPLQITEDGVKLSPKIADLSMMTTIPPSRLGGAWSGRL
jgi:hypothetical protein